MSWILSSVDPHFIFNLRSHKTAKDMWDYLKKMHNQVIKQGGFTWSMRWLIILREVSQMKNIFLVF